MYAVRGFFTMVLQRIKDSFTSGIAPNKLALSITLAIILGVFPFFFIPSLLILFCIFALRLNTAVMLVFNYLSWPLQIVLFIPYIHLGNRIFGSSTGDITFKNLTQAFKTDFFGAMHRLFSVLLNATGAWAISSIPAGIILFYILFFIAKSIPVTAAQKT
jgi:hypothetical protein